MLFDVRQNQLVFRKAFSPRKNKLVSRNKFKVVFLNSRAQRGTSQPNRRGFDFDVCENISFDRDTFLRGNFHEHVFVFLKCGHVYYKLIHFISNKFLYIRCIYYFSYHWTDLKLSKRKS